MLLTTVGLYKWVSMCPASLVRHNLTVLKKMVTGTLNAHKNAQKSSKNFKPSIQSVVSTYCFLSLCILDVLHVGSQSACIVAKCAVAIFLCTMD